MSYKPDESVLIAYLYGELDANEKEAVLHYLQQHPEELTKLQELTEVRKVMAGLKDKEVIAPPVFVDQEAPVISLWNTRYVKTIASIAASLLLLLIAGKVLGPDIRYSEGELRISFGSTKAGKAVSATPASLTAQNVQDMINTSLVKTTAKLDDHWTNTQQKMNAAIHQSLDNNSKKVDDLIRRTSDVSKEQLQTYVAGLQTENLRLMKDYLQLSAKEQNDYVENLLVGFSKYIQEQRAQDLLMVQTKVNSLEKDSDQFKEETEQLLTSIISNTTKKNSY